MGLLQEWRDFANSKDANDRAGQLFWADYFNKEKDVYKQLLANADKVYEGTVASLAKQFDLDLKYMAGFLDGINDSLKVPNPIEEMDKDTQVSLDYDKEKLYYNMVAARAEWCMSWKKWDGLLNRGKKKRFISPAKKFKHYC